MVKIIKNRQGWIRIVEAFVAILLVIGVVLIVLQQDRANRENISERVQNSMTAILRDIQLNNSLRSEIVNPAITPPIEWDNLPLLTKQKITAKTPSYLECSAKICATNDVCLLTGNQEKTIYAESIIISSTIQTYNPRQFKLFCWEKS